MLVTRFLDYSSSFLALFANPRGVQLIDRVMNAQVELLVRLHLAGIVWGDCSLANTLFRFDAGTLAAWPRTSTRLSRRPTWWRVTSSCGRS